MKLPSKPCIVCAKPIPRQTVSTFVRPTKAEHRSTSNAITADLKTKEDCRPHTNLPYIVSVRKGIDGFISEFRAWDGESYQSEFFCTTNCAATQGYASARQGDRYVWK